MDEILHALVPFAVFGFPATVAIAFRWFRHRERMAAGAARHDPAVEARLARLEQALDGVAIEMERMGEGQRFVTRLLADRAAERGAGRAADATIGVDQRERVFAQR